MDPAQLTTRELLYGIMITGAIVFAVGLVPLAVGIWKKRAKLGLLGLISSMIGGAILGLLLAVPIAAIFTWWIIKEPKTEAPAESYEVKDSSSADHP